MPGLTPVSVPVERYTRLLVFVAAILVPMAAHAQTGSISGTVTSAANGAPIVDIQVGAFNLDDFWSFGVGQADATGAYTITGLVPGRYVVFTGAERDPAFDYLDEFFDNIPCPINNDCDFPEGIDATFISVTSGGTVPNVNFALDRLGRVSGTVTDAATGAPAANVAVTAVARFGTSIVTLGSATTNTSGVYTITRLAAGNVYLYTSNTQGLINEIFDNVTCVGSCSPTTAVTAGTAVPVTAGGTTTSRDFSLGQGGRLSGTITNAASGAPIASLGVQAATRIGGSIAIIGSAQTNASGVFTIGGLATGNYFLFTTGGGGGVMNKLYDNIPCALNCNPIVQSGEEIAVTAGQLVSGKNFAMEVGGTISGTVTNQTNGAPLQNAVITVATRIGTTTFQRNSTTNASGQWSVTGLPTGTYWAYVATPPAGFVPEIFDNIPCLGLCNANTAIATGAPISATVGSNTTGRNFALAPGGGISGSVTETGTGNPIEDAEVQLYALSGTSRVLMGTAGVADDGTFAFVGLTPGTYFLATFEAFAHRNEAWDNLPCVGVSCSSAVIASATPIVVTSGVVVTGRNFVLDRAETLFGKVMSSTGQPLAGATVSLYHVASGGLAGTTTVDYRGGFGFSHLTNGSYVAFTSNSMGYRNEIYNDIPCATTCSPATALATGTPIVVSGAGSFASPELITGIRFVLDPRTDAPGAPTNFRAVVSGFTAQFSWTAPTPSTTGIATSYVIDAGVSPGGTVVSLPVPAASGTNFTVPGVPGGVFYVRVRAVNGAGSGPPSNEVTLVISGGGASPPDAPTAPLGFMSGPGGSFLTFTWNPAATGSTPTGYILEAGSASGRSDIATLPVAGRSFTFPGVPNGFYFLRVRAVNAGGVSPPSPEFLLVVGGVPAPPPPPNFNASSASNNTVTLGWVAPASGSPTSYVIEAGSGPGLANLATVNTGTTSTTAAFSGVPSGTYYVRVRAVNAQGASIASNERTIVVP